MLAFADAVRQTVSVRKEKAPGPGEEWRYRLLPRPCRLQETLRFPRSEHHFIQHLPVNLEGETTRRRRQHLSKSF